MRNNSPIHPSLVFADQIYFGQKLKINMNDLIVLKLFEFLFNIYILLFRLNY